MQIAQGNKLSKYIAIDVGTKRVGLAASDDLGIIAKPVLTIERDGAVEYIAGLVETEKVSRIVVGLPYLPSGRLGSQSKDVIEFVEELHKETDLPIDYENEVLTSVEAENRLKSLSKKRINKADVDAMAACIILESYLNNQ